MKRLVLVICFALLGATVMQAQSGLRIGANVGLPVGDIEEVSNFQAGADLAYLLGVADMLYIGPKIGYTQFFMEEDNFGGFEVDDPAFLPISASGRISLVRGFFFGTDLGYAVGLNDGNDGGFYYRPQVGYNFGIIGLVGSYTGISADDGSFGAINLGIEFGL
ncbi:hypothetical protein APR41_16490 [Salegentibacter salinarum]|uniref:Outer membrane protein beta-barrel domain-containing protein n=1 Tax=Salegentibacter salinarum TaxID=447422 RepID=A0A2N0TWT4_9FLAO|nr:hypothetical protein [Salegentibacter salinarum]PKD19189.1 hypothetical protein APR41_16490 [Salegentibacter salinarum]SKB94094.1 hypothetical protein SAMN05660903_03373 [Salegentibacter salinarum]